MAVVVESSSTTPWTTPTTSLVITKPTGLQVGDLLLAHVATTDNTTYTAPAGWATVRSNATLNEGTMYVFSKTADSSDAAASNFTFTSGTSAVLGGGLMRISGGVAGSINSTIGTAANNATPSLSGLTPTVASSMLLILSFVRSDTSGPDTGSWAIATDNPTWLETYDVVLGARGLAAASATRSQITTTGNFSFAFPPGGGSSDSTGVLVVIPPTTPATATAALLTAAFTTLAVTLPFTALANALSATLSLLGVTAGQANTGWTNAPKHSSSWVNPDKT